MVQNGVELFPAENTTLPNSTQPLHDATQLLPNTTQPLHKATLCAMRSGIRIHRGSKPEHSSGCVLVVADNTLRGKGIGRSAADVERELTSLILKAQQEHEEIILEVSDFRAGTEYGYNHPCERELQQHEIYARRAELRYHELHPEERKD